jgi:hypothetical protein
MTFVIAGIHRRPAGRQDGLPGETKPGDQPPGDRDG